MPLKEIKEIEVKVGKLGSLYSFDLVRNLFGEYVRIQRRRVSRTKATYLRQGVIIPYNSFDSFLNAVNKIKELTNSMTIIRLTIQMLLPLLFLHLIFMVFSPMNFVPYPFMGYISHSA